MPAATVLAKNTVGLLSSFRQDADGQVKKLMEEEWEWLKKDWGCHDVWQVQLALMALDTPSEYPTILSQALFSAGLNGVTLEIPELLPVREEPQPSDSVMQGLETFLWDEIRDAWESGKGEKTLRELMVTIRMLAGEGYTKLQQFRHATGGWFVNPSCGTAAQRDGFLTAVVGALGGFRYNTGDQVAKGNPAAADGVREVVGYENGDDPEEIARLMAEMSDESAQSDQEKYRRQGLTINIRRKRRGVVPAFVGASNPTIISHAGDEEGEEVGNGLVYETEISTGFIRGYEEMSNEVLMKKLV